MDLKKRILLKISGEILLSSDNTRPCAEKISSVISQIKQLKKSHQFGIVIGGGNFFRGSQHGKALGLGSAAGHAVGMLATAMNSLIVQDICKQHQVDVTILSSFFCPSVGDTISQHTIDQALDNNQLIIFAGGTGNPFFTTDTSAVLRALQIGASEVWKGTNVDGIYSADPRIHREAQLLKSVSYNQALKQRYGIMDSTAYAMAQEHALPIRIFNLSHKDSLIDVARNQDIGSIIS